MKRSITFVACSLIATPLLFAQQRISSTTAGGSATSASTWVGGQVPGRNQQAIIKGPVVLNTDWLNGVYGIVINGGSFTSDGHSHTLSIGSYGDDPVGAVCGGVVGAPGSCATMFGIVQTGNGGRVNLSNVRIVTPDGISPIYTRNQVYGNHPSDFTLQNCSIQNLGTSIGSNGYSGLVFAAGGLPSLNVLVNNCVISRYYRLLYGGTASSVQSSLTWTNNKSENETAMDLGSIVLTNAGFRRTRIMSDTDRHAAGAGFYIYSYDIGFSPVIEEVRVQGGTYKRGLYQSIAGSQGTGNATIANNICLNAVGSLGTTPCVAIHNTAASDVKTVITGLVSAGNYETVQLRPTNGNHSTVVYVTQSFLSEDWDVCRDQGIIMIGGMSPIITYNILRLTGTKSTCPYNIGFFDYSGTNNSILDNNTIIGSHGVATAGAYFGESGFAVYNQIARNNIIMSWDVCVSDNNRFPSQSTYLPDPDDDSDAGVHHNATFDCSAAKYRDYGGLHFSNSSRTAHPNSFAYGDIDGINPVFVDRSLRDPFKYDARFGGTGNGERMFSQFASGQLTVAQVKNWIFDGYAPTSASYRFGHGTFIGAVSPQ
jgi:hypothetical protein